MPSKDISNLLNDRVEFKLYVAEKLLNNLQEIVGKNQNTENQRNELQTEMDIDCFLVQILAAIDALLIQIDIKLELGIATEKVDLDTIRSALNARTKNISLVTELHKASEYNNWLWRLKEFRNQTMQRPAVQVQDNFFKNIKDISSELPTKSTAVPGEYLNEDLIPYFKESVRRVRQLVNSIRMKEPLLK